MGVANMQNQSTTANQLRDDVLNGRLSRRQMLKRAAALGLSAPAIAALLAACGGGESDEPTSTTSTGGDSTPRGDGGSTSTPDTEETPDSGSTVTRGRGQGDMLKMLFWQAPTILNTHLSQGDKDAGAARLVLEPLINVLQDGSFEPVLAEEVPSLENGGVAPDGLSVTYKLKKDVVWSDGEPFTAEDIKFTWEWVTDPDTSASTKALYDVIADVEIVDDHTVTLKFNEPNPAWYTIFAGTYNGTVLPKHILDDYRGAKASEAPFNLNPVGTGPYKVVDFRPGDVVIYEINENYREPDKPFFKQVEWKGGGDPASAGRGVLQTGDYDFAWNLQVEKAVLDQLATGEFGEIVANRGQSTEQVIFNFADPNTEVDGARSEPSTQHPFLTDDRVREALALASDRDTIAEALYGLSGEATANIVVAPEKFISKNTSYEYNLEKAAALLDEAGWELKGQYREKDGQQLAVTFATTVNQLRQKEQEILKDGWEKIGVRTELLAIESSVFFAADAGNPDTNAHFYWDIQMFTNGPGVAFPLRLLSYFKSHDPDKDLAQKSNTWSGQNIQRWVNEEFNELYSQAEVELDPDKQVELIVKMNDMLVNQHVRISLVHRAIPHAVSHRLKGINFSTWEMPGYDIANWYMED